MTPAMESHQTLRGCVDAATSARGLAVLVVDVCSTSDKMRPVDGDAGRVVAETRLGRLEPALFKCNPALARRLPQSVLSRILAACESGSMAVRQAPLC